jgi:hypothetical protein
MRAFMWLVSVRNPACDPVKLSASTPMLCRAMHTSAIAFRSPAVTSMSISRPGRIDDVSVARRSSSSVSLPMADTTSTTWSPWRRVRATWSATSRIRSGSATEVPPNFWTSRAMAAPEAIGARRDRRTRWRRPGSNAAGRDRRPTAGPDRAL